MLAETLQKHGLKATKPREFVWKAINDRKQPLSAQKLVSLLSSKVDQATVYRILQLFEKKRILKIDVIDGEKRYYIANAEHHHIVCRVCNKTTCVPCSHELPKIKGFKNVKHNMNLTGICNNCN